MKVVIKGRVSTINRFINSLQNEGHCELERVVYPPSWKFARAADFSSVVIELSSNYVNFEVLRKNTYKSLEVQGKGASFSFIKKKGSTFVEYLKQAEKRVNSEKVYKQTINSKSSINYIQEETEPVLGLYDTMELYEEQLKAMSGF